ncbi:GtrA family protein [Sphingosinicella sp. BN140058]|nr:GtrA family protein [Sphingosinicella sp. BN140058]
MRAAGASRLRRLAGIAQSCRCSHVQDGPGTSTLNRIEHGLALLRRGPIAWIRDPEARRFLLFLLVGGLNTLVGYGIFAALILIGLPTPAAVIAGTVLGILFNFVSTGSVVFRNRTGRLLPRFVAVYVVQMGMNIAAISALERAGLPPLTAGALMVPPLAIFTYFAMRRFVFVDVD